MSLSYAYKSICAYLRASRRGGTHAERMERLFANRASEFDATRDRFEPGRKELYEKLPTPEGGVWIDLGAGTGANLEFLGARLAKLGKVYLVETAPSLRAIARQRIENRGWH